MLTPLALFVGLLLATAFIAHWSDNLGKKLGKKRVSVFGLRPRTSATLLTVASSWGIMIFTLVALLVVVAPLRRALFRYDAVRADLATSSVRLQDAQADLERTQLGLERTQSDLKGAQKANSSARMSAQKARSDAKQARAQAAQSQRQARAAQKDLRIAQAGERDAKKGFLIASADTRRAQAIAGRAQSAASNARQQEQAAQAELATTQTQLAQSKTQLDQSKKRLAQSKARLQLAGAKLSAIEARLVDAGPRYKAALGKAAQAYQETARAQVAAAQAKQEAERIKIDAEAEVERAQREVNTLKAQQDDLNRKIAALRDQDLLLKRVFIAGDILIPVNQTLAERRFETGTSIQDIERQLHILLDNSQTAVKKIIPGVHVSVAITDTDPSTGTEINLSDDEVINEYARLLARANQPVSARLVSALNYPADALEILGRFAFVRIRTIYAAHDDIAKATIDTSKSESAIFGQLQRLVDEARRQAVKKGASPPLSPDDQNFFDGDTGPKLFEALRQVQKYGHPVEVRVVAARDLDAAEPLQVRFLVGDQT